MYTSKNFYVLRGLTYYLHSCKTRPYAALCNDFQLRVLLSFPRKARLFFHKKRVWKSSMTVVLTFQIIASLEIFASKIRPSFVFRTSLTTTKKLLFFAYHEVLHVIKRCLWMPKIKFSHLCSKGYVVINIHDISCCQMKFQACQTRFSSTLSNNLFFER